jgi:threonine synthase
MAGLLGEYQQQEDHELHILVATSGDTGGAVAAAFHQVEGIRVHILYPEGKVSDLQERQIAGLGGNIHSLAIAGTFDDCQTLVKKAFIDPTLREDLRMTSANSINVARWIPQSLPYVESYRQCTHYPESRSFVVPCGNLGNFSAGLLAQALGLPVDSWVVSTNENDSFVQYLDHGHHNAKPPVSTLAHAMDVGDPSNLDRVRILQGSTWNITSQLFRGYRVTDLQITDCIQSVFRNHGLQLDPHTATAWHALDADRKLAFNPGRPILMATANPSKFEKLMCRILGPSGDETSISHPWEWINHQLLPNDYSMFKDYLLSRIH